MCEIAVIPATDDDDRIDRMVALAHLLYQENSHGLGILAVFTDGDTFKYRKHKSGYDDQEPSWDGAVRTFFKTNSSAWRFVVHARLATAGEHTATNTHPLSTNQCSETPWDYVVHNGVVSAWKHRRKVLESKGHYFHTDVDSEVIAHATSEPDSFDDFEDNWTAARLSGSLNYLLFNENHILIGNTGKYVITDEFKMACNVRSWVDEADAEGGWWMFSPDGESQFQENETSYGNYPYINQARFSRYYGRSSTGQSKTDAEGHSNRGRTNGQTRTISGWTQASSGQTTNQGETKNRQTTIASETQARSYSTEDEHWGYVELEDSFVCREHGKEFTHVCTQCYNQGVMPDQVPTQSHPDYYRGGDPYVALRDGNDIKLEECSATSAYYIGKYCPVCNTNCNANGLAPPPYYE